MDTTARDFANVLERETLTVSYREFPAGRGRLILQRANSDAGSEPTRVTIDGVFIYATDDEGESGYPVPGVIKFDLLRVSSQRVEVEVTSHEQAVAAYYVELLERMANIWPEAQPVILPHLRQVRAQLGVYQPPEPGSAEARTLDTFLALVVNPAAGDRQSDPQPIATETITNIVGQRMRLFAQGKWKGNFEMLQNSLFAFRKPYQQVKFGEHDFHFYIWENPAYSDPGRYWMIGSHAYNRDTLRVGTPENPAPDFQGWPYAEVIAREVPGALKVELWHNDIYLTAMQGYLGKLRDALAEDGLELMPIQPGEASTMQPVATGVGDEQRAHIITIRGTVPDFVTWLRDLCAEMYRKGVAPVVAFADIFEDGRFARINLEQPYRYNDGGPIYTGVAHIKAVRVPDGVKLTVEYDDQDWPQGYKSATWHDEFVAALKRDSWWIDPQPAMTGAGGIVVGDNFSGVIIQGNNSTMTNTNRSGGVDINVPGGTVNINRNVVGRDEKSSEDQRHEQVDD